MSGKELASDSSEKCGHVKDKIVYRVILTFKRTSQHSSYSNLVFCRTPSMGDERRSPSEINGEIDEKAMLKTKNGRKNGKRHLNGSINGSAKKIKKVDNGIFKKFMLFFSNSGGRQGFREWQGRKRRGNAVCNGDSAQRQSQRITQRDTDQRGKHKRKRKWIVCLYVHSCHCNGEWTCQGRGTEK